MKPIVRQLAWILTAAAALLFTPVTATATTPTFELGGGFDLGITAQYRPRVMVHTGLDLVDKGKETRHHFDQRARLGLIVGHESGVKVKVLVQDVRTWGEEGNTLNDFSADGFDVHEAWAHVPIYGGLSVRVGRQEVIFDNHRLIGNVGWSQRARSFDGAVLNFKWQELVIDAVYARVLEGDMSGGGHVADADGNVPAGRVHDINLGALRVFYTLSDAFKASVTYIVNVDDTSETTRHIAGLYARGGISGFTYDAEFYYQFGDMGDESISALMAAVKVGYQLDVVTKPYIKAWFEYLSGDKDSKPQGTFETPYPTNHKFYGEMDYFLAIGKNTAFLGLMDIGGRIGLSPTEWFGLYVDFHHFRAANEDPNGESGFGNELDVKLIFKPYKIVAVRAVYGMFMPDEAMRTPRGIAKDVDLQTEHMFYLTLDVTI